MKSYLFTDSSNRPALSSDLYLITLKANEVSGSDRLISEERVGSIAGAFEDNPELIGIVSADILKTLRSDALANLADVVVHNASLAILVSRKTPPADCRRYDGVVQSYICSRTLWDAALAAGRLLEEPEYSCYRTLELLMSGEIRADWVCVRQLPAAAPKPMGVPRPEPIAVVMAHRGLHRHLAVAADYVKRLSYPGRISFRLGLDVADLSEYDDFVTSNRMTCFSVEDPPAGPYVIRDALIRTAPEGLVLFQDSDDVSCSDRATRLLQAMMNARADMVGSHEMEINEIDKTIRVYRFPLQVTDVLSARANAGVSDNAAEPFLHATALMKRQKYLEVGGFSTNRRIANDSQFLLRGHFAMKIENVDEFLYLRRVHPRALTVDPATRNGNELRQQLSAQWGRDFRLIKAGELALDKSSLRAVREDRSRRIAPIGSTLAGVERTSA